MNTISTLKETLTESQEDFLNQNIEAIRQDWFNPQFKLFYDGNSFNIKTCNRLYSYVTEWNAYIENITENANVNLAVIPGEFKLYEIYLKAIKESFINYLFGSIIEFLQKPLVTNSLSFAKEDKLYKNQLIKIAKDVKNKLGVEDIVCHDLHSIIVNSSFQSNPVFEHVIDFTPQAKAYLKVCLGSCSLQFRNWFNNKNHDQFNTEFIHNQNFPYQDELDDYPTTIVEDATYQSEINNGPWFDQ